MNSRRTSRIIGPISAPLGVSAAAILTVCFANLPNFAPALYSADWVHIVWGNWTDTWLDFSYPWPLLKAPFFIQDRAFQLNIHAYYAVLGAYQVSLSLILYRIVRYVGNNFDILHGKLFSFSISLLFLVYPTIYTRMWLTMAFFYVPILLALLSGFYLLKFADTGKTSYLILAILLSLLSLGAYEIQLGLVCAWSLILFALYRKVEFHRRLVTLIPASMVGVYAIWRISAFENEAGKYSLLTGIAETGPDLLSNLVAGYEISLGYGWTTSVRHFLPWVPTEMHAAALAAGGVLITWLALWLWFSAAGQRPSDRRQAADARLWPMDQRWPSICAYLFAGLVGLFLIAAGYMPIILKHWASMAGSASRYNFPATIGSSVLLASVFMTGAIALARNRHQVGLFFLVAVMPFIFLGIAAQNVVQSNARTAWKEQGSIYSQLFSLAPSFKEDTAIVLVLNGFGDRVGRWDHWQRVPIGSDWALSSALQLFYDDPTLSGYRVHPDIDGRPVSALGLRGIASPIPSVEKSNMVRIRLDAFTPYERSVFFEHDSETNSLRLMTELPAELVQGASGPISLSTDRILSKGPSKIRERALIADR